MKKVIGLLVAMMLAKDVYAGILTDNLSLQSGTSIVTLTHADVDSLKGLAPTNELKEIYAATPTNGSPDNAVATVAYLRTTVVSNSAYASVAAVASNAYQLGGIAAENYVTNGQSGVTLAGTFSGNGGSLTNVSADYATDAGTASYASSAGYVSVAAFATNAQTATNALQLGGVVASAYVTNNASGVNFGGLTVGGNTVLTNEALFLASAAYGITSGNTNNWQSSYVWVNANSNTVASKAYVNAVSNSLYLGDALRVVQSNTNAWISVRNGEAYLDIVTNQYAGITTNTAYVVVTSSTLTYGSPPNFPFTVGSVGTVGLDGGGFTNASFTISGMSWTMEKLPFSSPARWQLYLTILGPTMATTVVGHPALPVTFPAGGQYVGSATVDWMQTTNYVVVTNSYLIATTNWVASQGYLTNNQSGVTLAGTFSGNGGGLTNVAYASVAAFATNAQNATNSYQLGGVVASAYPTQNQANVNFGTNLTVSGNPVLTNAPAADLTQWAYYPATSNVDVNTHDMLGVVTVQGATFTDSLHLYAVPASIGEGVLGTAIDLNHHSLVLQGLGARQTFTSIGAGDALFAFENVTGSGTGVSIISNQTGMIASNNFLFSGGNPVLTNVSYVGQAGTSAYANVSGYASVANLATNALTATNSLQLGGVAASAYMTNDVDTLQSVVDRGSTSTNSRGWSLELDNYSYMVRAKHDGYNAYLGWPDMAAYFSGGGGVAFEVCQSNVAGRFTVGGTDARLGYFDLGGGSRYYGLHVVNGNVTAFVNDGDVGGRFQYTGGGYAVWGEAGAAGHVGFAGGGGLTYFENGTFSMDAATNVLVRGKLYMGNSTNMVADENGFLFSGGNPVLTNVVVTIPSYYITNNQSGVTLAGTFSGVFTNGTYYGNGAGLTNLNIAGLTNGQSNLSVSNLTIWGNERYSNSVWDDVQVPLVISGAAGTYKPPAWAKISTISGEIYAYQYQWQSTAGNEQEAMFSLQLPHRYKRGTDLHPHIHWMPSTTNLGNVVWGIEFVAGPLTGGFPVSSTTYKMTNSTIGGVSNQMIISEWDQVIPGSNLVESSCVFGRIFRNSSSAGDTYTVGSAIGISFDMHIEIDKPGSDDELPP